MTTTGTEAFEAMLAHHAALADGVERRVAALRSAVRAGSGHEPAVAELVAYVASEVLPHATAEEHALYRVAAGIGGLGATVTGMIDEHRRLTAAVERLATAAEADVALETAEAFGSLFAAHVGKENELVLPPLAASDGVDLAGLLLQMHRLTEAAQAGGSIEDDAAAADTETQLVRLLLGAARQLADAGRGDRACRLAAGAWAAVRVPRPDLAARVTAALHGLVRSVTAEQVTFSSGPPSATARSGATLDVRSLAPAQRHDTIFAAYGALTPGAGFVLVNDHDPKPLRYQFEAEHAGDFTWDVLEAGPTVWQVRIGRQVVGTGTAAPAGAEPELDVRRFPHGQRHDVIFTTFDSLAEGGGFVLVNDHDPRPLRYQFEAQHAGGYSWDYLQAGPDVWRVRISRAVGAAR